MLTVELCEARVELAVADALLVPVDGLICKLGGASAAALRAALSDDERGDELEYVEDALGRLRPLQHPAAHAVDGVAHWSTLVVSAAYPHNVDGAIHSPHDCARMLRAAIPVALATAAAHGARSIAATLIGTAYRMPADLAVRAFVDALAASATTAIAVRWSLPDSEHRELALDAARRVSLRVR